MKQVNVEVATAYVAANDYPYLKKWPAKSGQGPTDATLLIAHALGLKPGTKQALGCAAYLRPGGAHTRTIARALHMAWAGDATVCDHISNCIIGRGGVAHSDVGYVKLVKLPLGGRSVNWQLIPNAKTIALVDKHCKAHGYINPLPAYATELKYYDGPDNDEWCKAVSQFIDRVGLPEKTKMPKNRPSKATGKVKALPVPNDQPTLETAVQPANELVGAV